jgi:hypothetical protein
MEQIIVDVFPEVFASPTWTNRGEERKDMREVLLGRQSETDNAHRGKLPWRLVRQ